MTQAILYDYAMSFNGKPYIWGGDDPVIGFDCSGLVIELLQSQGILPRGYDSTAQNLYLTLRKAGNNQALDFGTCLFFGADIGRITHTGFALSPAIMLEAGGGGPGVRDFQSAAAKNAYIRVRPINWRGDLVAKNMPNYSWRKS